MARLPVPLGTLEIFLAAGRLCSFKEAAAELCLSPSAVSQSIRRLELRLDCTLFVKHGNNLTMTAEGQRLFQNVREAFGKINEGFLEISRAATVNTISISSPPGIASQLLTPVIRLAINRWNIDVRIVSDEKPDFQSHTLLDIAIIYGNRASELKNVTSLGPDVFRPVSNASLAAQIQSAEDMLNFPLITNETNAVSWDDWLRLNGVSNRKTRYIRVDRGVQSIAAMRSGLGVGFESIRVLAGEIEAGDLVILKIPGSKPVIRNLTYLYTNPSPERMEIKTIVADLVREACETDKDGLRTCKRS